MAKTITPVKSGSYFTQHEGGVTVYHDGRSFAASTAHPFYEDVLKALAKRDVAKAAELLDVKGTLQAAAAGIERIKFKEGRMLYKSPNGQEQDLEGPLVDRILLAIKQGGLTPKQVRPLMVFMDNVMKNPVKFVRDELYQFLMAGKQPITKDGCFLALKKIRRDYKDVYTGTLDNSPGKLVAMAREKVDPNRHNTCSTGLHFAAESYMGSYSGERIVVVKVNPRDVIAIPTDYNFAKGRACEYFVVGELTSMKEFEAFKAPFIFDENRLEATKGITFTESIDKGVSLKARAEAYGLSIDGKALVRTVTSKGQLTADRYVVCREVSTGQFVDALTGKPVPEDHVKLMSVETKSVRSALVRAVAKARKLFK